MFKINPYNRAVKIFRKIREIAPGTPKYKNTVLEVIRYSKEAIKKNKNDGDSHILLANAYYLACLIDFPSENYSRYLPLAAAVIFEWRSRPMYSKEKAIGEKIYHGIKEALNRDIPEWMDVSKPEGTIKELHSRYYQDAIV